MQETAQPMAPVERGPGLALRLPKDDQVPFRGVVNLDNAGGTPGGMLYPAPGVAGLVAAVITHAFVSESVRSAEKTRIQTSADLVLAPYQEILQRFQNRELMQKGLEKSLFGKPKRLAEAAEDISSDWVIDSIPSYSMTYDRSAIILENVLTIRKPGALHDEAYQNTVRVVSQAKVSDDLKAFWAIDQGASLKDESVRLFAASLDLGLADAQRASGEAHAHKTVRYKEGTAEKMERGEVLDEHCGRIVIRTLRGWVMSVPARSSGAPTTAAEQCG
ncbi:MAG: hypothetical protein V4532_01145 [Pseudomonadota bacterium]